MALGYYELLLCTKAISQGSALPVKAERGIKDGDTEATVGAHETGTVENAADF